MRKLFAQLLSDLSVLSQNCPLNHSLKIIKIFTTVAPINRIRSITVAYDLMTAFILHFYGNLITSNIPTSPYLAVKSQCSYNEKAPTICFLSLVSFNWDHMVSVEISPPFIQRNCLEKKSTKINAHSHFTRAWILNIIHRKSGRDREGERAKEWWHTYAHFIVH